MNFVGIDPGLAGAIAMVSADGRLQLIKDIPVMKVGKRTMYDLPTIASWIRQLDQTTDQCAIELVHAFPGQGVTSMWKMGYGVGIWEALFAMQGLPYHQVTPQAWKAIMLNGIPKSKGAARYRASQLWPDWAHQFSRRKDDGRAEAALIAEWVRRTCHTGSA